METDARDELTSFTAYAKHVGVSAQMVSKAYRKGRLTKAAVVLVNGQPKIRDIAVADAEWFSSMSRLPRKSQQPAGPNAPSVQRTFDLQSAPSAATHSLAVFTSLEPAPPEIALAVTDLDVPDAEDGFVFRLTIAGAQIVAQGLMQAVKRARAGQDDLGIAQREDLARR
jgi:hypothetical protein